MKNKLHIFGCSHSTDIHCSDINVPFWADYIADEFNLKRYPRVGHGGKNVEYILFDIFDRILNNDIGKDDLVILNTSYPLRFGTPRLQRFHKHPMDNDFDTYDILGIAKESIPSFDKLDKALTFNLWYNQTFGAWKLLNSVCDNVYQWTMLDIVELDELYASIQYDFIHPEWPKKSKATEYQLNNYPDRNRCTNNPWKNIIKYPTDVRNWDDFIFQNKFGNDGHMAPDNHVKFSKPFINQIKYES